MRRIRGARFGAITLLAVGFSVTPPSTRAAVVALAVVISLALTRPTGAADLIYPFTGSTAPHLIAWDLTSAAGTGPADCFDVEAENVFTLGPWTRVGDCIAAAALCSTWTTRTGQTRTTCRFAMPDRTAQYRVRSVNAGYGAGAWVTEAASELMRCCRAAAPLPDTCYAGLAQIQGACL